MRKLVIAAVVVTVPIAAVAVREGLRYSAGLGEPGVSGSGSLLFVVGAGMALVPLWSGILIAAKMKRRMENRTPFDVAAAIAVAEARKRPPAPVCRACGRPRLTESSPRCAFCGAAWSTA